MHIFNNFFLVCFSKNNHMHIFNNFLQLPFFIRSFSSWLHFVHFLPFFSHQIHRRNCRGRYQKPSTTSHHVIAVWSIFLTRKSCSNSSRSPHSQPRSLLSSTTFIIQLQSWSSKKFFFVFLFCFDLFMDDFFSIFLNNL